MSKEILPKRHWSPDDVRRDLGICFYQVITWGPTSEAAESTAEKIVNGQTIIEDPNLAVLSIQYAIVQGDESIASFELGCSPADLKEYLIVLRDCILTLMRHRA